MQVNPISFARTAQIALAAGLTISIIGCTRNPQSEKQRYLKSGIQYLQKGKYEEAILQFRNALKLDPRYADAYYQLAQAYESEHDYNSAYNAIRQAVALDANRVDLRLSLAEIYVLGRQYANAEEEATLVLKKDPNSAAAYRVLASAQLAEGKKEAAIAAFLKLMQLKPEDLTTYGSAGIVEMSLNKNVDAEKHFRAAVDRGPHFLQGYLNLAGFYRRTGRLADAERVLESGIGKNPESTALRLAQADLLFSEQKPELAERALESIRKSNSKSAAVALSLGNFYFSRGAADKALEEYRRGAAIDPHNVEIQNQMVECYLLTGRTKDAEALNSRIVKERPKDVTATLARGRILLTSGRNEEAISVLRSLLAHSQDSAQVHYFLGLAYWQNQNVPQAKTELQESLREAPGLLVAQHSLAGLHMSLGELPAARELAEQIVRNNPANADERMLLGTIYVRQGQISAAREQFLIARRLIPGNAPAAVDLAQADNALGKRDEAEKEYQAALVLNPRFVQALNGLASLWVQQNQNAKALARVQQYVASYPDDSAGHLLLGALYSAAKQYQIAKNEFERATQLDPKLISAHTQLGDACRALGDMNGAIRAYEDAAALEPKSAGLQTLLGNLYLLEENRERAQTHYQLALAANPNDAVAANNLAWIYLKNGGNLDIALGLAQKAKEAQPDVVNVTDTLGWIQYRKGLYAGAVSLLEDCVAKAPQSPLYRYHLGMALLGNGDGRNAKAQLEAALRLKLTGEDAQQARQTLERLN
jgi:tetratricopeptide (TPR) repeat protein